MSDLIILVADKDTEQLLEGLLIRIPQTELTRSFDYKILKHPQRDGGVRTDAVDFLRTFMSDVQKLLIVFDYEGCGENQLNAVELEQKIENDLVANGWTAANICICVINPELENWVWISENAMNKHLDLDWKETETIKEWLALQNFTYHINHKPIKPKEAFQKLLEQQNITWSASLFKKLAKSSYKNCQDPTFLKMLDCLKLWFS